MKRIVTVDWDCDDTTPEEIGLPIEVEIPDEISENEISDWLSDEYGFCVNGWTY